MHSGCITAHYHFYQNLKGTFLQKMHVNIKDVCVSLENKKQTG